MHPHKQTGLIPSAVSSRVLRAAAAVALLLALAPAGRAQSPDSQPAALEKQRTALFLKASHAPLAELESEINHLAQLSEICRIEHSAAACGLPDTSIGSDKLEDRYSYYVRRPVEAHLKGPGVKIERRNWDVPSAPNSR